MTNGEKPPTRPVELVPPPTPPTPPPPAQPEEFFPGFRAESTRIAQTRYQVQKRVNDASRQLEKVRRMGIAHPLSRLPGFRPPPGFIAPVGGGIALEEDVQQLVAEAQEEFQLATQRVVQVV